MLFKKITNNTDVAIKMVFYKSHCFLTRWIGLGGCLLAVVACYFPVAHAAELTQYPGSTLLEQSEIDGSYALALGALRNVNGRWRPDSQMRVEGLGTRFIYELAREVALRDVLEHHQQQMQVLGGQPLFVCFAHKCGSSASWANEHFSQRQLYGLDQYQRYAAYQLPGAEKDIIVVLYMVTRGNKRSYLLVDYIELDQAIKSTPTVDTVKALLEEGQHIPVPLVQVESQWQLETEFAQLISRLLKLDPTLKLAMAVSDHRSKSFDRNLFQSQALGETLISQLDISERMQERVRVQGIGSTVPKRNIEITVWLFEYH